MKKVLLISIILSVGMLNGKLVLAQSENEGTSAAAGDQNNVKELKTDDSNVKIRTITDVNEVLLRHERLKERIQQRRLDRLEKRRSERTELRRAEAEGIKKDGNSVVDSAAGRAFDEKDMTPTQKLMVDEVAKHTQRIARLNRIRELAVEQNKTDIIERVDKLLKKEQTRYGQKRANIREKVHKELQLLRKKEAKTIDPNRLITDPNRLNIERRVHILKQSKEQNLNR